MQSGSPWRFVQHFEYMIVNYAIYQLGSRDSQMPFLKFPILYVLQGGPLKEKKRGVYYSSTRPLNFLFKPCFSYILDNSKTLFFYDVFGANQPFMRYSHFKCNIIGYFQPARMLTLLRLSNSAWKLCFSYISHNSKTLFFYDVSVGNQPLKRYSYFKCNTNLLYSQIGLELSSAKELGQVRLG